MIVCPDMSNPGIGAGGHGSYGVIYYGKGATGGGYKEPTGPTFDQVAANGAAQAGQRAQVDPHLGAAAPAAAAHHLAGRHPLLLDRRRASPSTR